MYTKSIRILSSSKSLLVPMLFAFVLLIVAFYISLPARAQNSPVISLSHISGQSGQLIQISGSGFTPGGYEGSILVNGEIVETFDIPGSVSGGSSGGNFSVPFYIPLSLGATALTCSKSVHLIRAQLVNSSNAMARATRSVPWHQILAVASPLSTEAYWMWRRSMLDS